MVALDVTAEGIVARTGARVQGAPRRFLAWCEQQKYVDAAPTVPTTGQRITGTAFVLRRRGKATELTGDEARAIIERLPEYSASKRVAPFVVRLRFVVAFKTALRPETLNCLKAPDHYVRGAATLNITDDIDKVRFGRVLPLTEEARAALDAVCPDSGLIFGDHDYRDQLRKAANAVLDVQRAKTFTAYDLRHHRLTQLAEGGNLLGTAFLAGHKRATTTDRYLHPSQQAGQRALGSVRATGFRQPPPNLTRNRNLLAGVAKSATPLSLCEGEDLNLHGSYPASTSS